MNRSDKRLYYDAAGIEAIVVIENLNMNFNEGNAFKYLYRCNNNMPKGEVLEDLKKARYYLNRLIRKPSTNKSIWGNKYIAMIREDVFNPLIYKSICCLIDAVGGKNTCYISLLYSSMEYLEDEIAQY